eukprot:m.47051 g.47051  ORF g.47051 m.47051 type:complete len:267 (-) comp6837_c0_seq1:117-917(-)
MQRWRTANGESAVALHSAVSKGTMVFGHANTSHCARKEPLLPLTTPLWAAAQMHATDSAAHTEDEGIDRVDLTDADARNLGFDPRHPARTKAERCSQEPADDPKQRFMQTAHRLKQEIPRLIEPATLSKDLLDSRLTLVDNTMRVSVQGRIAHDLVLGAAAAGTKLALVNPRLNMLSYVPNASTRTITCRWQIVGTPRMPLATVHHDRVSVFEVDARGKIVKHTIDRISTSHRPEDDTLLDMLFPSAHACRGAALGYAVLWQPFST